MRKLHICAHCKSKVANPYELRNGEVICGFCFERLQRELKKIKDKLYGKEGL